MNKICEKCSLNNNCISCESDCNKCIALDYIKIGGIENYNKFKKILLNEINILLRANNIPQAETLCEVAGCYVNLEYPVPNGKMIKFLDDRKIYLGTQIEFADLGVCYGVVADTNFILVCSYSVNGSEPELIVYQKR